MKALTICQPYAHLICLPDDHARAKRVENRTWSTAYRGELLIHAGKSRKFLKLSPDGKRDDGYDLPLCDMSFGAIVAVARLADCFGVQHPMDKASAFRRRQWLAGHEHVEGPFCFVLTEVRVFSTPIPYSGKQGFFDVPHELVEAEINRSEATPCNS